MKYRMIALDLDGTLLDTHGAVRPSTKAAVAAARDRGVDVVLVTGRHHVATRPYHVELGLGSPAICCNGTYVYDFAGARVVIGAPMSKPQARDVLELCRRHDVHCLLYVENAMTFEVANAHVQRLCNWGDGLSPDVRPDIHRVDSFENTIETASHVWKFVVAHDDPSVLSAWQIDAARSGGLSIEASWTNRLDVVCAGNTKGMRLLKWATTRGVDPSEIIAFGDNHNDLSMVASVGLGVAMGNGEDALKAVAQLVTGGNDSDGIAETIERFVLRSA
jgi:Cof subfamily protein (haloacid dehalogenase superfamily)